MREYGMKDGLKLVLVLGVAIVIVAGGIYLRYKTFDFEAEDAGQKLQQEYEATHSAGR
jgi:hypothetical protein